MLNESNDIVDLDEYVKGFTLMSNNELLDFLNINRLSFSINQILYIQSYFKNVKRMFPTYNQILFFNEINKINQSQKKGYSVYSVSSTENADSIMETSNDLLSKKKTLRPNFLGPMPLSYASRVASEYLHHIGCDEYSMPFIPAKNDVSPRYYIHTNDSVPLFVYSSSNSPEITHIEVKSTTNHNTFVMICPIDDDMDNSEYRTHAEEFLSLPEIKTASSEHSTVKPPFGMFEPLMKETNGILVNLANIPEIEMNENGKVKSLSSLFSSCIGRYFFVTNNASVGILNKLAEGYSLKIRIFAIRNKSYTFSFESVKNPSFSFNFGFLQNIMNFTEDREYVFTDEISAPLGKKEHVYLTDNKIEEKQTYRAEKILYFDKYLLTATARNLDLSPHKSAALTVIDAINTLIAKGVSKDAISLSIHYSLLCGTDDSKELGKNFASILGAYRSMIELCVSDKAPQIRYNKKKRNIVVLASAKAPKRQINSSFSNGNTNLYFYQIEYDENGLPDYKKHREFIKLYYLMIEQDDILSAFAINENFSSMLQNASLNTTVSFDESFNERSMENLHGILFEIPKSIDISDRLPRVGETVEKY